MFSIDAAVRAQLRKALEKAVEPRVPVTSKKLAGKLVRDEHSRQASCIVVTDAVFSSGKLVRELQLYQALSNVVAAVVFKLGNVPVSCVQPLNALAKLVTVEVSQVVGISYKYLIAGAYTELL